MIIGSLVLWGTTEYKYLNLGRLIIGFGLGKNFVASLVYLYESTPSKLRQNTIQGYHLMYTLGIVISYFCSIWMNTHNMEFMMGMAALPALL